MNYVSHRTAVRVETNIDELKIIKRALEQLVENDYKSLVPTKYEINFLIQEIDSILEGLSR